MEYSYLTPHKLSILNSFLYERPKEALSYVNLPSDVPQFDTNTKIYYFQYDSYGLKYLKLIYEYQNNKYCLKLWKWEEMVWLLGSIEAWFKFAKRKGRKIYKSITEEAVKLLNIEDNPFNYYYLKGKLTVNPDFNSDSLVKRIIPDYKLGSFDEGEIQRLTGKSIEEIITFDTVHNNLDFCELFVRKCSLRKNYFNKYNCDLTTFEGTNFDESNYSQIYNFLYQEYQGSKSAWYGFGPYEFDDFYYNHNHIVIIRRGGKYMFVHYCDQYNPGTRCNFSLITKVYDSFRELWDNLNNQQKSAIIKEYL